MNEIDTEIERFVVKFDQSKMTITSHTMYYMGFHKTSMPVEPLNGPWKSKYGAKLEFPEGWGGFKVKKSSMGEEWVFSGTTQCSYI